jgi:16S rRNA (uracil1498-N3)-methyltransferase
MHRFYISDSIDSINVLSDEESSHAIRVLRLNLNDVIILLDGNGKAYEASIIEASPKKCVVKLLENIIVEEPAKSSLHIAIAPTKNIDRFEWFVEKATEIGISEITPIITSQSERRNLNQDRIKKILVSAMKQSKRLFIPKFNDLVKFDTFIHKTENLHSQKFIAHCLENEKKSFAELIDRSLDCIILIGPEGDFNESEINLSISKSFIPVSFGNARLRTETAGVFATSIFNQ